MPSDYNIALKREKCKIHEKKEGKNVFSASQLRSAVEKANPAGIRRPQAGPGSPSLRTPVFSLPVIEKDFVPAELHYPDPLFFLFRLFFRIVVI